VLEPGHVAAALEDPRESGAFHLGRVRIVDVVDIDAIDDAVDRIEQVGVRLQLWVGRGASGEPEADGEAAVEVTRLPVLRPADAAQVAAAIIATTMSLSGAQVQSEPSAWFRRGG
jgi:hypothetical protein